MEDQLDTKSFHFHHVEHIAIALFLKKATEKFQSIITHKFLITIINNTMPPDGRDCLEHAT